MFSTRPRDKFTQTSRVNSLALSDFFWESDGLLGLVDSNCRKWQKLVFNFLGSGCFQHQILKGIRTHLQFQMNFLWSPRKRQAYWCEDLKR